MINNFNKKKIIISGVTLLLCCMVIPVSCTTFITPNKDCDAISPEVTPKPTDIPEREPTTEPEPTFDTNIYDTDTWQSLIKSDWLSTDIGFGCIMKFVKNDSVAGCNIYLNGSGRLVVGRYNSPYVKIDNDGEIFIQLPENLDKAPFGMKNDSVELEYKLVLEGDTLYLDDVVFRRSTHTLIEDENGYRLEKNNSAEEVE